MMTMFHMILTLVHVSFVIEACVSALTLHLMSVDAPSCEDEDDIDSSQSDVKYEVELTLLAEGDISCVHPIV
jgi:hypothetical protein